MRRILVHQILVIWGLLAANSLSARADDWPQWLGPTRDSQWRETDVIEKFPSGGPKVLWRTPIAGGYSGPAVAAGRVFVTDYMRTSGDAVNDPGARPELKGRERVLCLDASSGKELWKHEYDCNYSISYPAGPRATPAVDGDRLYVLGAEGNLHCLDVATGKVVWHVELKKAYGAPTPLWGFCSHPLIDGDTLYVLAGGEGSVAVALDKRTGQKKWQALSDRDAGYCSPSIVDAGGTRQLIVWHPTAVNGLDPATGAVHWTVPLVPDYGMSINTPTRVGDHLFAAGIKSKGVMLRLAADKPAVEELWRSNSQRGMGPVHSPPVAVGEFLFGVDGEGELTCLEPASGKRLWRTYEATTRSRRANSSTAFLVRNGERFYIFNENGELLIARLTPEGYTELDRAALLKPTHEAFGRTVLWSHPAFANRAMFARNGEELICVSLAE